MTDHIRQLAAVMFTDISGYTALMGRDERLALELLHTNRQIQKPLIEKYHGTWIKEMGDGTLARFDSAYNATKCAIEIQQTAKRELKAQLRIGLHLGEVTTEEGDIFGDGVNVASRIESIADPGGIYVSEAIQKALHNRPEIHTKYLGEVLLKNVDEPLKIYCVEGEGLTVPDKNKIKKLREGLAHKESKVKRFFKHPVFSVLILLLAVGFFIIRNLETVKQSRKVHSIAILPFANFTGSDEQQYFVDMMHDAVIGEISKIGNLIVKSRTSTLQFKDSKLSIPEIAKILNVDAIIESSVFSTGDSVALEVQLIQARPVEDHIWAERYKRDTRHILSLYSELAKTVANEVSVQLTPREDIQFSNRKEVDPEAYQAYLKAQFHAEKLSKPDLDLAEKYFQKSIDIDPTYAPAFFGLSGIGASKAQMGLITNESAREQTRFYMEKALALDSNLWEAHASLAGISVWQDWEFKKGIKEFEKAIELNPNNARTRVYYGQALCMIYNDYEKAIHEADYALELDPLNNLIKGIYGQNMNFCRKYDQAEKLLKEVLESDPTNDIALSNIRTTYHMEQKYTQAYETWKIYYKSDSLAVEALERGYQIGGYSGALKELADYFVKKSDTKFITPWRIFTTYVRAGLKDEALDWLEKSYEAHDPNTPFINTDPIFDDLRNHPRFLAVLQKLNLPDN